MRWPWRRRETRSGGGYSDTIVRALEAAAAAEAASVGSTAALEAAAGALARAFAAAEVEGPAWAREAVTPSWLALVGRSVLRSGESLSVVAMDAAGRVELVPAAFWSWEGFDGAGESEASWRARVTTYGPSSSHTRVLGRERLVFLPWGVSPGTRYRGAGPTGWASLTAKTQAEAERTLADEMAGPVAQLLPIPADGGDGGDDDPLKSLKADVTAARGKALLVETTSAGWGAGREAAPGVGNQDWRASRLGPQPPEAVVRVADQAFQRMLAACGCPPSLFVDADGTAQREAVRRWHLGTVVPLARLLAHELSARLETEIRLRFDAYPLDLAGRAQAFQKLVAGGVAVNEALAVSGLLAEEV